MKGKRQKHVKKTLNFYRQFFNLDAPFTVVVDGTFCKAALEARMNILEQLPKYLDAQVNVVTSGCILEECKRFKDFGLHGPLKILEQYDAVPCKHKPKLPKYKPASVCMMKFARRQDKMKCIIATQDESLIASVHKVAGVPLLTMVHGVVTLQAPSTASHLSAKQTLSQSLAPTDHQHAILKQLKREAFGEQLETPMKKRKRKGPKGANPLSCMKKKKPSVPSELKDGDKPKRKRKRKRKFGSVVE